MTHDGVAGEAASTSGAAAAPGTAAAAPGTATGPKPGLVRLAFALVAVNVTTYLAIFGVLNVILPALIETTAGKGGKEAALGIITTLGAVVAMVASPVWGALSDRHNPRLGRRGGWILAGAAGLLVALNIVGAGRVLIVIGAGWCLSQLTVNATLMGISTALPERVPRERRGLMSGVVGMASGLAIALAAFVGAAFVSAPLAGTLTLSVLAFAGAVSYLIIAPESREVPPAAAARPAILASMLSSLRGAPDFRWTLIGRFLVILGYWLIQARMLYFVQNRLGLGLQAGAREVATITAIGGAALIAGLVVTAPLSDRFGRKPFVYAAGAGIAAGLALLAGTRTTTGILAAGALTGLAFGSFLGVDQALVADVLPSKDDAARDLGVINLAATLPQTLAPALGTVVLLVSGGSYTALIGAGAAVALASVYATWRIKGVR